MISIIISAYNSEKTINKAITSCLNQTYKDIEVIVINDCSTDNTDSIISELSLKDNRIKYFKNAKNRGAGYARYRGISHIKGEYVTFVDSDDYIKEDFIETLYNAAIKYDSELISSGMYIVKGENVEEHIPSKEIALKGLKKYDCYSKTYQFLNSSLIKTSLIKKVKYSKNRYIEDTPVIIKLLWYANKRTYIKYAGYYYIQNSSSLCHTASDFKNWVFLSLLCIEIIDFFKDKYPKFSDIQLLKDQIYKLNSIKVNKKEYKKYTKELSYIFDYYNKNK